MRPGPRSPTIHAMHRRHETLTADAPRHHAAGTSGTPAVSVRQLSKRYGDVAAVDGLTFTLERGTITGFLGPNGAGKTTTLRLLLGLAEPSMWNSTATSTPETTSVHAGHLRRANSVPAAVSARATAAGCRLRPPWRTSPATITAPTSTGTAASTNASWRRNTATRI